MGSAYQKITALIPCLNEEEGIGNVIKAFPVRELRKHGYELEIVVIDNNSEDRTAEIARSLGATVIHEPHRGKGNAIRRGFYHVSENTDYVVMLDGDNTYCPGEILRLVELLSSRFCTVAIGSRLGGRISRGSMTVVNRLGNWIYSHLIRLLYRVNVTDVLSGYFAWKRDALVKLRPHLVSKGFAIEMEMVTKMARLGEEIYCVPISYNPRNGKTNLRPIRDGTRILLMLVRNFFWQPTESRERITRGASSRAPFAKILSVSHYYPPHVGGLEIVTQKLVESLYTAGRIVSVVTFAGNGETAGESSERGVRVTRVRGLNFFDTRFGIPFPIGGFGLVRALSREVRSADAIHLNDVLYQSSWLTYLFARWYNKPLILTQHIGMADHPSRMIMHIQRIVYATFGTLIFKYALNIIVYNKHVADFLEAREVPPRKILELRNGVDVSLFSPLRDSDRKTVRSQFKLPKNRPLVLFVGRFVPKKGFDLVYEAHDPSYDLVFVGSGAFPVEWAETPRVHVLGTLSQSQLAKLYPIVDVCVFPSRGEVFTLVMQEAMACGVPIITSDEPAYRAYDLDRQSISFVEPTADSLRSAIKRILADQDLRERIGAYSRALAEQWFDWTKNIQPVLDLYSDLETKRSSIIVTTSWDDGHVLDQKLASLLKKYGITGTFFIAPENRELPPDERLCKENVLQLAQDFEIGAHTMTHPYLLDVDEATAHREIVSSKETLQQWIHRPVRSFCYPKGGYRKIHKHMVRDAGFTHARTTKRFSLSRSADSYALSTSVHTYDHWSDVWRILAFVRFNPLQFFQLYHRWDLQAIALFDRALREGGVFHLWGHSWEIEKHNDWDRLERVLQHIGKRAEVQYRTFSEV